MSTERSHTVPAAEHGSRLDAFTARAENCGVRAAKRLIEEGAVQVDGKRRPAHFKLHGGNCVRIRRATPPLFPETLPLAGVFGEYLAFVKPAGLHTARIAGSAEQSLEQILAAQWERIQKSSPPPQSGIVPDFLRAALGYSSPSSPLCGAEPAPAALPSTPPLLLSRLDAVTSGVVLAASATDAAGMFRKMEALGQVDKYYLTVIDGILEENITVTNALDTANRARTRVLPEAEPDVTRHTGVCPLGAAAAFSILGAGEGTTLAAVRIKRGSRHQIRAHLAHAGFPLLGDALYGPERRDTPFRLHHARLAIPESSFFSLPPWLPSS